jgi:hypothetical protein
MEFIDGETLEHQMTAHGSPLPLDRVTSILRAIASGLDAVHAKKLVHRDVKPGNIVIEVSTGRPVLVDFGLAANVRPTDGRTSFVGGTPYYMAPEQSQNVSAILAGHLHRPPPLLSTTHPDLAPIDAPLQRALSKKPHDRFETCEAFIAALELAFGSVTAPVIEAPRAAAARLVLADTTDTSGRQNPTLDPSALQAAIPKRSGPALFLLGGVAVLVATLGYAAVRSSDKSATVQSAAAGGASHSASAPATEIPPPPPTATSIDVSSLPQASAQPTATIPAKIQAISHPPPVAPPPTATPTTKPAPSKPHSAYDDFGERK